MEQKSFHSGIKVQSSSKSIATIPAIPALPAIPHSLRWNRRNRWNTLPAQPISKNCHIPFTIPLFHLFPFLKIVKRDAVLDDYGHYVWKETVFPNRFANLRIIDEVMYQSIKRYQVPRETPGQMTEIFAQEGRAFDLKIN